MPKRRPTPDHGRGALAPGVHVQEVPPPASRAITAVPTSVTAFVGRALTGPTDRPVVVRGFAEYERVFGGLREDSHLGRAVRDFFRNGGRTAVVVRLLPADGQALTRDDVVGADLQATGKGLFLLDRADLFNLLVIPSDGDATDPAVVAGAATYCEQRRALLLVDPPAGWRTPADAVSAMGQGPSSALGTASANAAVWFPRLLEADPLHADRLEEVAPSGAVAGVIARTDAERGVWKAPAGTTAALAGVTALAVDVGDDDNGALNPLGVNCLRVLPGAGPVVWGARTLHGADALGSEWKYVPVRRTALFLEECLDRGLQWTVFEPNDERLWAQVRLQVDGFLHGLFRQGAFAGASPREAYFVRCGRDTMTEADLDDGVIVVEIGFAPQKPAEFVVLRLRQRAGRARRP